MFIARLRLRLMVVPARSGLCPSLRILVPRQNQEEQEDVERHLLVFYALVQVYFVGWMEKSQWPMANG